MAGSSDASSTPSAEVGAAAELTRIALVVPSDAAERALVAAVDALGRGCEQRDAADGTTTLVFWTPPEEGAQAAADLRALGVGPVETGTEDGAWRDAMRAFHTPIEVGGRLRVRPPWTAPVAGLLDVVIDPGMAFGTGQHATTRGCLELMLAIPPGPVLDVGCGSGVLAIAARRLGWEPVMAVDFDPLAVDATVANAAANGVDVVVAQADIATDPLPATPVLVANLTADLLGVLARAVHRAPPRWAVLSGLRPAETDAVVAAWAPLGLMVRDRRDADDWTALLMEAPR